MLSRDRIKSKPEINDEGENNITSNQVIGYNPWSDIEMAILQIRGKLENDNLPVEKVEEKVIDPYEYMKTNYESSFRGRMINRPRSSKMDYQNIRVKRDLPDMSLADLSYHYSNVNNKDLTEIINLLISCRRLEKVIEEQNQVLEILEVDLKDAREALNYPPEWRETSGYRLRPGHIPPTESYIPSSDPPIYIRGDDNLLPQEYRKNIKEDDKKIQKNHYN